MITAWVAFTDATPENGYMQFLPGSHKVDQLPHVDTFHKDNLLSRGQEIAVEVDKSKGVGVPLKAGESRCTTSSWCTAPSPTAAATGASASRSATSPPSKADKVRDSAMLVRGVDKFVLPTTSRGRGRTWTRGVAADADSVERR